MHSKNARLHINICELGSVEFLWLVKLINSVHWRLGDRYLKNGRIVVIKHVIFQLYQAYSAEVIWKNHLLTTNISKSVLELS